MYVCGYSLYIPHLETAPYAGNIDSVVLRQCLEGLCTVIDPVASAQDKEVVVSLQTCRSITCYFQRRIYRTMLGTL